MRLTRRAFALGTLALSAACRAAVPKQRKLKILVLGGTNFVGPAAVEAALKAGHEITLFNRGKTNPNLFPHLELIRGDRDRKTEDLSGLQGNRRWDAVIDVWPADAAVSQRTGELLKDRVGRYIYVSSISAYATLKQPGATEQAPLVTSLAEGDDYGLQKAETERRLQALYGSRFSSVRPTAIMGWRDEGDELTFWAVRMQRGGDVMAPGDGNDPVQFVDVKDVGDTLVAIAARNLAGPFNMVGPAQPMNMRSFLERIRSATGNKATLIWIPDEFLLSQGLKDYSNFPMYRPLSRTTRPGFHRVSNARALAEGMTFRPLEQTIADALRWFPIYRGSQFEFGGVGQPAAAAWWLKMGIPRARELALIKAWRDSQRPTA